MSDTRADGLTDGTYDAGRYVATPALWIGTKAFVVDNWNRVTAATTIKDTMLDRIIVTIGFVTVAT